MPTVSICVLIGVGRTVGVTVGECRGEEIDTHLVFITHKMHPLDMRKKIREWCILCVRKNEMCEMMSPQNKKEENRAAVSLCLLCVAANVFFSFLSVG